MNIGLITIHYGTNYGSSLQAYALFQKIKKIQPNAHIEIINYIPERYSRKNRYLNTKKSLTGHKKILYLLFSAPLRFLNERIFVKFQRKYLSLPKACNKDNIKQRYGNFDIVIVGSDQVWNSDYNNGFDDNYYLGFVSDGAKKIAYAASCGKTDYSDEEWDKMIRYLNRFTAISVREKDTQIMLTAKGINNCQWVLDPTFFLKKEEWVELEKEASHNLKDFVLIYSLDNDEDSLIPIAKKIADLYSSKTVIIEYGHPWLRFNTDCTLLNRAPEQFIWLINHAKYVVTNSFHGVAFSINFEKQFVAVRRKKYNNRLDSILSMFNLENRYVDNFSDLEKMEEIDYSDVNLIKSKELVKSEDFLYSVLK